jgi:hypothetical protein
MTTLVTALYAEGPTDQRFLPLIIQRTAVQILSQRGHTIVDVLEPMLVEPPEKGERDQSILAVARRVYGYHLLFVHADADAPTATAALRQRIAPGMALVQAAQQQGETVCTDLVPIIPVQMTEAWMLVDRDALLAMIGALSDHHDLDIPVRPQQVEQIADPKQQLSRIFAEALASRTRRIRRRRRIAELYEPLGRTVDLTALAQTPSYQQFVADLT